jgi:Arc/MetJ-type ribon-helix-helix transcriptional regulator
MVRAQVQFTEEQLAAVRNVARERRVSVSQVVRDGVDLLLEQHQSPSREELVRRSLEMLDMFGSGTGDVSARHDDYFAEASEP